MKTEIDPAALEAFLQAHPEAAKELEAITVRKHEIQARAAEMLAELNGDEELGAEFERQAAGGTITDVPAPKARAPRAAAQPKTPKQPRQPKAAKQPSVGGPGRPTVASLEALSAEDFEAKLAFAKTNNKPWLLGKLMEIKKARGKSAAPAPAAKPALRVAGGTAADKPKGQGWQGKAGGEPKSMGEANARLKVAKAGGHETMVQKLEGWIEAHKRTTVNRADGARKTAGAFGRAFAGRSGGGASASPQQSAQG